MCSLVVGIEHGARSPQTVAERETTSSRTALVRRTLNFRGCPSVRTEACCTSVTSRPARWSRGTRRYLHATLKAPASVRDPSSSSIVSSSTLPGAPSEALEMANIPKSTCPEVSPLEISKATSPMSHENRLISSQATKRWVPRLPLPHRRSRRGRGQRWGLLPEPQRRVQAALTTHSFPPRLGAMRRPGRGSEPRLVQHG